MLQLLGEQFKSRREKQVKGVGYNMKDKVEQWESCKVTHLEKSDKTSNIQRTLKPSMECDLATHPPGWVLSHLSKLKT